MDKESVRQLCNLARIDLSEAEEGEFAEKFNSLLAFVEQLLAYKSSDAPSDAERAERSAAGHTLELRRDAVEDCSWPEGTVHDYRVSRIINFEGDA